MEGICKEARCSARQDFGYLARDYGVDFSEVDWIKALEDGILFKVKTTATKRDKFAIEKSLTKALEDATAEPLPGEDEEEDESEEPSK